MSEVIIVPEIERVASENQIATDGMMAMQAAFAPHFQSFATLAKEARTVQENEPKKARTLRLKIRAVRIAAEDARKELKADSLRRSKAIDGINNILLHSLVPVEEGLERIEKAEEIREAQRREALKQARAAELAPYADPSFYDLAGMPDAQYADLLAGLKAAHAAKIAAEKEAQRIAEERAAAEKAERERIIAENARLAKIAAEERAARDEAERKAAAEKAEAARLAKIEADKREAAERARREQERKERQEAEAKAQAALAAERKAREEAERKAREEQAKARAIIEAREKAERDRIAREEAEARRAAAAPDAEKVRALAVMIDGIELPELSDAAVTIKIREQFADMASWLRKTADKMGA
jgi:colicin import membrane protein